MMLMHRLASIALGEVRTPRFNQLDGTFGRGGCGRNGRHAAAYAAAIDLRRRMFSVPGASSQTVAAASGAQGLPVKRAIAAAAACCADLRQ